MEMNGLKIPETMNNCLKQMVKLNGLPDNDVAINAVRTSFEAVILTVKKCWDSKVSVDKRGSTFNGPQFSHEEAMDFFSANDSITIELESYLEGKSALPLKIKKGMSWHTNKFAVLNIPKPIKDFWPVSPMEWLERFAPIQNYCVPAERILEYIQSKLWRNVSSNEDGQRYEIITLINNTVKIVSIGWRVDFRGNNAGGFIDWKSGDVDTYRKKLKEYGGSTLGRGNEMLSTSKENTVTISIQNLADSMTYPAQLFCSSDSPLNVKVGK